ncbi:MAG: hypothetical protein UHN88_04215 [Eubacterium sp.]|nr:hypothetical protein [Eubacterium sp.]
MGSAKTEWLKKPYLSGNAEKEIRKIRRAVDKRSWYPGLYLITIAASDRDMLDIISARYLLEKSVADRLPVIVGAAFGRGEAMDLITRMAEDTFRATGGCDIRSFLMRQNRTEEEN